MKKVPAFFDFITGRNFLTTLVLLVTLVISIQTYLLGPREWDGVVYTHYNNYKIFESSFDHLIHQLDLYAPYPGDHYDLYKYSPTFALLMAPFSVLPDWLGLLFWNLLNGLLLLVAVLKLPGLDRRQTAWLVLIILIELITSLRNNQSNALIAGLVLMAFVNLEKDRPVAASLLLALTVYIKIFTLASLSLALLYPSRYRFGAYWMMWMVVLWLLPLIAVPFQQLAELYRGWWSLLSTDQAVYHGISVMGLLHAWLDIATGKNVLIVTGAALYLVPFIFIRRYHSELFRLKLLASVLIWMVIFNHMAESPTYIIAMTGVGIWFFTSKRNWIDISLLILALLLTSVSMTDLTPNAWKDAVIKPYVLKALPAIIIWIKLNAELILDIKSKRKESCP